MTILRSMEQFDYKVFRDKLKAQNFSSSQMAMLSLRLSLLDACLKGGNATNRVSTHFRQGHLTIIEYATFYIPPFCTATNIRLGRSLSSPFMDSSSACSFFDIILGLFVGVRTVSSAKLIGTPLFIFSCVNILLLNYGRTVLDEAHKVSHAIRKLCGYHGLLSFPSTCRIREAPRASLSPCSA